MITEVPVVTRLFFALLIIVGSGRKCPSSLGFHHPLQLLHLFLSSIVVLLRLQSNLVDDFRLILLGFCAILRGFCAIFGLLEEHHRLQHIWCVGCNFFSFGNSLNALAMTILQSF